MASNPEDVLAQFAPDPLASFAVDTPAAPDPLANFTPLPASDPLEQFAVGVGDTLAEFEPDDPAAAFSADADRVSEFDSGASPDDIFTRTMEGIGARARSIGGSLLEGFGGVAASAVEAIPQVAKAGLRAGAAQALGPTVAFGSPEQKHVVRDLRDIATGAAGIKVAGTQEFNDAANFVREISDIPEEKIVDGFFTRTLPEAVGQTGAFAVAAAAGVAAGVPPWITVASLGSAVGGVEGRQEALDAGATEAQADIAFGANALFGTSEAIPITKLIDRVDQSTGGIISKALKRNFVANIGKFGAASERIIRSGTAGFFEEGLQEAFQQIGGNLTAADFAGYDPGRTPLEGVLAAGIEGGAVGVTLNVLAASLGVKLDVDTRKRVRDEARARGVDPGDIDNFGGPAVILSDRYLELQVKLAEQKARTLDAARETNDLATPDTEGILPPEKQAPNADDIADQDEDVRLPFEAAALESTVSPIENFPEGTNVSTAIESSPVVLTGFDYYATQLHNFEITNKEIEDAGGREEAKIPMEKVREAAAVEKETSKAIKEFTADFRQRFLPDTRIIVSDGKFSRNIDRNSEHKGWQMSTERGQTFYFGDRIVVELDPRLLEGMLDDKHNLAKVKERLYSTLVHELGHSVINQRLRQLEIDAETNAAAAQIHEAILTEYRVWLERAATEPVNESLQGFLSPAFLRADREFSVDRAFNAANAQAIAEGTVTAGEVREDLPRPREALGDKFFEYIYSFDEYAAETIARIGSSQESVLGLTGKFFGEVKKRLERFHGLTRNHFKEVPPVFDAWVQTLSIEGQLREEAQFAPVVGPEDIGKLAKALGADVGDTLKDDLDVFNRGIGLTFNLTQIGKKNPHIAGLQRYIAATRAWWNSRISWAANADTRVIGWRGLPKEDQTTLSRLLYEQTLAERFFTPVELAENYSMGIEGQQLFTEISKDFARVLEQMEGMTVREAQRIFASDPLALQAELKKIEREFQILKNKPFFPLSRFGSFGVSVREADGTVVEFETFDTEREARRGQARLQGENPTLKVGVRPFSATHKAIQGLPSPVVERMRHVLDLTDEQQSAFNEVLADSNPVNSFKRHFLRRKKTPGFAEDAMRTYADYFNRAAGHMARLEHGPDMQNAIASVGNDARAIERNGGVAVKRQRIADHLVEHLDYLMNPGNEWAGIRNFGFMYFLGYNLKSAFVNTTQVPLVTLPYLSSKFGEVGAVREIGKAYSTGLKYWRNPDKVDPLLMEAIGKGIAAGFLDESLATELASTASAENVDSMLPIGKGRIWKRLSYYGTLPFHTAEKMNRFVTFIAAYELAKADGQTQGESFKEGRLAVDSTQFEYARWNRPELFRGKKSAVFLFMNYVQNMLFFALGGEVAAIRLWYSLFAVAGLTGLPFADDLLDVVDALAKQKWFRRMTGWKDPSLQAEVYMRDALNELDVNADLVMNGLSRRSMGAGYLGEAFGLPIPDIDLSGSMSMGNILPTEGLSEVRPGGSAESFVSKSLEGAGGALAQPIASTLQAAFTNNPDTWKRTEKVLPIFMRGISKSVRLGARGQEQAAGGQVIAEFDTHDPVDMAELAAQSVGFTPERTSQGWEQFIATQNAIRFYQDSKTIVLRQLNHAKFNGDAESVEDAREHLRDYNDNVPFPELRIRRSTQKDSFRKFVRDRIRRQRGIEPTRAARRISREVGEVFEESQ